MTEGSYRSMDLGELSGAFAKFDPSVMTLRPVLGLPDSVHPDDYVEPVYQAALGPIEVSTSMALVPVSSLPVWDVNRYYRDLGVEYPFRPSKRDLRLAYMGSGGMDSARSTFAFQQLLDKELRARYDLRPLGQPIDDRYRWEALRRVACLWAAEQSRATGNIVTIEDILGEDIIKRMAAQAEAETKQAEMKMKGQLDDEETARPEAELPFVWPFAYFLWGSRKFDDERLARWQQMLIQSFSRKGLSLQVAVGYFGRATGEAVRMRYPNLTGGYTQILFLHENAEPTTSLADIVVGTYYNYPYDVPLPEPLHLYDHL